jgi:hypothetical protein
MIKALKENVQEYDEINGVIKDNLKNVWQRKSALEIRLTYDSERRALRSQDKKRTGTSEVRFLRSVPGVTLTKKWEVGT